MNSFTAFRPGMFEDNAYGKGHFMVWPRHLYWYGREYGYPKCCTQHFVEMFSGLRPKLYGPWIGTGFLPCERCAIKISRRGFGTYVKHTIAPARRFKKPFPKDDMD